MLTASSYGIISSVTEDQTAKLQAFLNEPGPKLIDLKSVRYSTPMVMKSGLRLFGLGGFSSYLVPVNCAAFTINGVNDILLDDVTIWPQGTTPPSTILPIANSYNVHFRKVKIHGNSSYTPSVASIQLGVGSNCIHFDHCISRLDGSLDGAAYFPINVQSLPGCGAVNFTNCDLETASIGVQHKGGNLTISGLYMERVGKWGITFDNGSDLASSISVLGGIIHGDAEGLPIAIQANCHDMRIAGTALTRPDGRQGWVYGMGSRNLNVELANYDPSKWGGVLQNILIS